MQDVTIIQAAKEIGMSRATLARFEVGEEIDSRNLVLILRWAMEQL